MSEVDYVTSESSIGQDDFGTGGLQDLLVMVRDVADALAPEVEFGVEAEREGKKLHFTFTFPDDDKVGLFLGKKMSNLHALFHFIEHQQIMPHNKWVRIHIQKENETQTFEDRGFLRQFILNNGDDDE